jgi:hypothetical protein
LTRAGITGRLPQKCTKHVNRTPIICLRYFENVHISCHTLYYYLLLYYAYILYSYTKVCVKGCRYSFSERPAHPRCRSFSDPRTNIMLRDLLTQKCAHKKRLLILDTPEHVDTENIQLKIDHHFWVNKSLRMMWTQRRCRRRRRCGLCMTVCCSL